MSYRGKRLMVNSEGNKREAQAHQEGLHGLFNRGVIKVNTQTEKNEKILISSTLLQSEVEEQRELKEIDFREVLLAQYVDPPMFKPS